MFKAVNGALWKESGLEPCYPLKVLKGPCHTSPGSRRSSVLRRYPGLAAPNVHLLFFPLALTNDSDGKR